MKAIIKLDDVPAYQIGAPVRVYFPDSMMTDGVVEALELLKEQEPVEPKLVGVNTWICGECGALLGWEEFTQSGLELVENRFCPECGRRVKWNA